MAHFVLTALWLAAAAGKVVDPDGKPIAGAEVCWGAPPLQECAKTDAAGFYRVDDAGRKPLLIRAPGFVAVQVEAAEHVAPVALGRAATLTVRVVDAATGKPVPSGKVILNYTSGKNIGSSAPFGKNGVRITTLIPGEILARAESEGYEPGGPEAVVLEGGVEKTVTIGVRRKSAPRSR